VASVLGEISRADTWLLEIAIVLQIGLGKYIEAAVIGGLLLFNATLGFVQEGRANTALVALKKRLAPTALVRRDVAWVTFPASELVPGDAIGLSLGVLLPAVGYQIVFTCGYA